MADIAPAGMEIEVDLIPGANGPEEAVPVLADDAGADAGGLPPNARALADGSVELRLLYARTLTYRTGQDGPVRSEQYETLTFRRLTGADLRAMQAADADSRGIVAIARSTGIREAVMRRLFDAMDAADAQAAGEVVAGFLTTGRRTGR